MKIKFEYVALIVIIAALIIYLAVRSSDKTHYELPSVEKVDSSEITRITLERADSTVVDLTRSKDGWKIVPQGFKAEKSGVDRLAEELSGFELTTLVSESGIYSRYGLEDDEKIGVRAYAGDELVREFTIGKASSTRRHTFVRVGDDPNVYEARNNLRSLFDKDTNALRDKTVFVYETTAVTEISLSEGENTVSFQKKSVPPPVNPAAGEDNQPVPPPDETEWLASDGRKAKAESIKSLLRSLSNLKCDSFIAGKDKSDFTDPVFSIKLKETEPASIAIFEKNDDGKYPAVSSKSPYPFLLSEWRAKQLMKSPEELLAE